MKGYTDRGPARPSSVDIDYRQSDGPVRALRRLKVKPILILERSLGTAYLWAPLSKGV